MKSLQERLRQFAQGKNPYPEFLPLAQSNTPSTIRDVTKFMDEHASCAHLADDATLVLTHLIKDPVSFGQPEGIADLMMARGIRASAFFQKVTGNHALNESDVWGMCARDTRPETLRLSARLSAEFIRARLGGASAQGYAFPVEDIFTQGAVRLGPDFDKAVFKDAVVATQNALVDYVGSRRTSGELTTGGDILALLSDEPDLGSTIWTEKLADVKISRVYSETRGDVARYKLVFQQPQ